MPWRDIHFTSNLPRVTLPEDSAPTPNHPPPAPKDKGEQTKRKGLSPLFVWLRSIGVIALLFGVAPTIIVGWFWTGVSFFYLGFVVLVIDLWLEPRLEGRKRLKSLITVVILVVIWLFSAAVVFPGDPIEISATLTDAIYQPGTVNNGITWQPEFTQLIVTIRNPAPTKDVSDLDVRLQSDVPIVAISQITHISDVDMDNTNGVYIQFATPVIGSDKKVAIPLSVIASSGYRIRCSMLRQTQFIRLAVALGQPKESELPVGQPWLDVMQRKDFVQFMGVAEPYRFNYWLGYPGGATYLPRRIPNWLIASAQYVSTDRRRTQVTKLKRVGSVMQVQ